MGKVRWADMTDDDPIEFEFEIEEPPPTPPPKISRHGIKVAYVPPHLRTEPNKSSKPIDSK